MSKLSTLLGITAVGTSIAKARLMQRFVGDITNVISLAIATGLVIGALLIGGFYIAYQGLIRYGLDPFAAQILIAVISAITALVLLSITTSYIKRLKSIPAQLTHGEFPLSSRLNGLADSFLNGLLGSSANPKN